MQHFKPEEFQGYFDKLSPDLKVKLDNLREVWNKKIYISVAPGAVGRHLGPTNASRHNVDRWKEVQAVDVMPDGLENVSDAFMFYDMARKVGFTGIGFYPQWKPLPGFHLDVREAKFASWGRLGGVYVGIQSAFDSVC